MQLPPRRRQKDKKGGEAAQQVEEEEGRDGRQAVTAPPLTYLFVSLVALLPLPLQWRRRARRRGGPKGRY